MSDEEPGINKPWPRNEGWPEEAGWQKAQAEHWKAQHDVVIAALDELYRAKPGSRRDKAVRKRIKPWLT